MEIKVKSKEFPTPVIVNYDVPDTLGGLTEKFGDENVAALAGRAVVLAIQAIARQHLGSSTEEIQKHVDAWQPGVRQAGVRKTPLERATAALSGMSPEDLAALLAKVKAAAKHQ